MYQIGWFSTGRGDGSKGLLKVTQDSISSGELLANIEFIFCSRERGETEATDQYLDMVADYKIPLASLSYQKYKSARSMPTPNPFAPLPQWRLDYDTEVLELLRGFHPDLCVLAGFMLIVSPEVCRKYNMINLHPAAPDGPAGTWQEVIWQLIEHKADYQGVKMHVVIPELDVGPTATYCTFSLRGKPFDSYWDEIDGKSVIQVKREQGESNPLFQAIRKYGYTRELPLVVATLKVFSQGQVKLTDDKRVINASGVSINGYDLTNEIDEIVEDILLKEIDI
ncbi:phosphoribosylglycinamide formyltransferase [Chloroflexota bacterium]